jgi:hypothetical protein
LGFPWRVCIERISALRRPFSCRLLVAVTSCCCSGWGASHRELQPQTHLLNPRLHSDPARNVSVCISKYIAILSHVPQLRQCSNALFHRHRRARGLVRVFSGRHGYALLVAQVSQVFSHVVVVQVVMMCVKLGSLSQCWRLLSRGHVPPPIGRFH